MLHNRIYWTFIDSFPTVSQKIMQSKLIRKSQSGSGKNAASQTKLNRFSKCCSREYVGAFSGGKPQAASTLFTLGSCFLEARPALTSGHIVVHAYCRPIPTKAFILIE